MRRVFIYLYCNMSFFIFMPNIVLANQDVLSQEVQELKALIMEMKSDYETRINEMQDKIAELSEQQLVEEEDAELKKELDLLFNDKEDTSGKSPLTSKELTAPSLNNAVTSQFATSGTGSWSPSQAISLWNAGKSFMNISFDGLFTGTGSTAEDLAVLETGGHDPIQRGFTAQNEEIAFDGAVDPYFSGFANIVYQLNKKGETTVELEEAYLTTFSLPANLQVKAGTFFTEFGRLNPTHPHTWNFADQSLVNGRFFGEDGLRNPGARVSWLAPTDNYTELFFTIQDSQGETATSFRNNDSLFGRKAVETRVRNMKDMLYVPRITTMFELTDTQTLLLGASAAYGPNSTGIDKNTLIYGIDAFWKWKSKHASYGFPFITWQTEVMGRRFEAGEDIDADLPSDTMHNWGAYSEIAWGFKKRWVAGLRGDYVDGLKGATDPTGVERLRVSPNLTFYPSEFSKLRLQYNYDDILGNDNTEQSVFLQFEFLMGSHGAHKF